MPKLSLPWLLQPSYLSNRDITFISVHHPCQQWEQSYPSMASQRELNGSDETAHYGASGASSPAWDTRTTRLCLEATELELMPDSAILKQSLSLKSVILTTSSFNRQFQSACAYSELQKFNQIGSGLQGAVFEVVGQVLAFKKENPGNETLSSNLRREFAIHRDVSAAFDQYKHATHSQVHVPKPHEFISKTQHHTFWDEDFPKMPPAYRTRADVVKMDRILPLPKVVRKALISHSYGRDKHLDATDIETLLNEPKNKHCLARVYLGQTTGPMNLDTLARLEISLSTSGSWRNWASIPSRLQMKWARHMLSYTGVLA